MSFKDEPAVQKIDRMKEVYSDCSRTRLNSVRGYRLPVLTEEPSISEIGFGRHKKCYQRKI